MNATEVYSIWICENEQTVNFKNLKQIISQNLISYNQQNYPKIINLIDLHNYQDSIEELVQFILMSIKSSKRYVKSNAFKKIVLFILNIQFC